MLLTKPHNSQNGLISITLVVNKNVDIDLLLRKNLLRIMGRFQINQRQFALKAGIDPVLFNQILRGIKGMGKEIQTRICKAFDINFYEFYIDEKTPLPTSELEKKAIYMVREAEKANMGKVAEALIDYTAHRIETEKKEAKKVVGKGKGIRYKVGGG